MLRLTKHARQRAAERAISHEEIEEAVEGYEISFLDKKGNPCFTRQIGDRDIKVVIAADDEKLVITVIDLD